MEKENSKEKPSLGEHSRSTLKDIFTLDDVNFSQSMEDIKSEVSFKGFNVWILICSILICSLGLNMDSTAVVIGAMLISPLMGPIVGLGLGIGIFDKKLINKALKSIAVASVISIVTAYLFFKLTPTEDVSELISRTRPTILDLFVAFFGGVAGILAASRSQTTNVIPGVAIATALMPPLCTAGYGLAIGSVDYFLGAFYLFVMNCIMISLAALIVVLYLKYPKFSFVNEEKRKKARALILFVVLLVSIPSVYFYYNLLQDNLKQDHINAYIENEIVARPGIYLNSYTISEEGDSMLLNVNVSGNYIEKDTINSLSKRMVNYSLNGTLNIIQPQPIGFKEQRLASLKSDIITELYKNSSQELKTKDDEISMLKNEIKKLSIGQFVSGKISEIAKSQYDIEKMAVDIIVYSDNEKMDTIPTALVLWKPKLSKNKKKEQSEKLAALLKIQLGEEVIEIVDIK